MHAFRNKAFCPVVLDAGLAIKWIAWGVSPRPKVVAASWGLLRDRVMHLNIHVCATFPRAKLRGRPSPLKIKLTWYTGCKKIYLFNGLNKMSIGMNPAEVGYFSSNVWGFQETVPQL